MAVVVRSRRLVNPGYKKLERLKKRSQVSAYRSHAAQMAHRYQARKKRVLAKGGTPNIVNAFPKKNPTKRKKLSPKQIAFFGTPKQKAALRAARSRKRNAGAFSVRKWKKREKLSSSEAKSIWKPRATKTYEKRTGLAAPHGTNRARRSKLRKKNIGEIVSISLAGLNPGKKRNSGMAKRRKATAHKHRVVRRRVITRRRKGTTTMKRRRRNPVYRVKRVARRRNAGTPRMLSGVLGKAVGIIGGAVATRYATQMLLGGNNVGVMGYLGNAVSAFALGWGTGKLAGKEMGTNVMIGGFVSTILRVITDQTSLGKYINLSLQGAGKGGDIGMGIIQDSSFSLPQVNVPGSQTQFITPRNTRNYVDSAIANVRAATAPKPGMGNVFGGQQRRRVM